MRIQIRQCLKKKSVKEKISQIKYVLISNTKIVLCKDFFCDEYHACMSNIRIRWARKYRSESGCKTQLKGISFLLLTTPDVFYALSKVQTSLTQSKDV